LGPAVGSGKIQVMSLAPALLLSMPQLVDPNFARSVVLLCEHAPQGAFGLVVNRPSDVTAAVAVHLDPPLEQPNDLPLLIGGPVEPHSGWILTSQAPEDVEHRGLGAGLYLSASQALLRRVLSARPFPKRTHVLAGYAGWGPGQLDAELAESAWLIAPVELDLIFEIPSAASWEMAIRRLGADPHLLQMGHGVH
jgi:putative transcriptional regulator